ncbi:MAG: chorismate-binding protein, partial [Polyangiaceae bacterium]
MIAGDDFLRRALVRVAPASGARVIVLTAKAEPADFEARLADAKSTDFAWFPGDLSQTFDAWSIAGDGETLRVDAAGDDRWHRVREASHAATAHVVEEREEGVIAPPLRWLGGGSFHADTRDPAWAAFGGASFVVPRWSIGRRGEHAFVRFAFHAEELDRRDALLAEIDERIARAGMETPDPRARTISASVPPDADGVWIPLVEQALCEIERGAVQKIVVACRTSIPESVSPSATLARLRARNLRATSFSIRREDSVFLGATPERLIFSDKTHALT